MSARTVSMRALRLWVTAGVFIALTAGAAQAQSARKPAGTLVLGEITSLTVNDASNPDSGGRLVVDGQQIVIPDKLSITQPTGAATLQSLMVAASDDCKSQKPPQTGLATTDSCRGEQAPAIARVVASPNEKGELVATSVMLQKNSARTLSRIKGAPQGGDGSYGKAGGYSKRTRRPPQ